MKHPPQRITAPDGTAMIVLTEADYNELIDRADIAAADRALAESDFTVPDVVLGMILDGKSPVAAWREYRGITQSVLAADAGMLQPALARIERASKAKLHDATAAKLAAALDVPLWALSSR